MTTPKADRNGAAPKVEPDLDLTGLLGAGQVFAAGDGPRVQAELIDANCNKIGFEGSCCA